MPHLDKRNKAQLLRDLAAAEMQVDTHRQRAIEWRQYFTDTTAKLNAATQNIARMRDTQRESARLLRAYLSVYHSDYGKEWEADKNAAQRMIAHVIHELEVEAE